jgi:hypothetical protein
MKPKAFISSAFMSLSQKHLLPARVRDRKATSQFNFSVGSGGSGYWLIGGNQQVTGQAIVGAKLQENNMMPREGNRKSW